jgi:hypothetical protein
MLFQKREMKMKRGEDAIKQNQLWAKKDAGGLCRFHLFDLKMIEDQW